ncbi:hypothetical protein [Streptomyces sp. TS71-3]|nr:hypothetical protein [Streptomyces sp. TS71-3]
MYVALSDGSRLPARCSLLRLLGDGVLWHDHFAGGGAVPRPSLF